MALLATAIALTICLYQVCNAAPVPVNSECPLEEHEGPDIPVWLMMALDKGGFSRTVTYEKNGTTVCETEETGLDWQDDGDLEVCWTKTTVITDKDATYTMYESADMEIDGEALKEEFDDHACGCDSHTNHPPDDRHPCGCTSSNEEEYTKPNMDDEREEEILENIQSENFSEKQDQQQCSCILNNEADETKPKTDEETKEEEPQNVEDEKSSEEQQTCGFNLNGRADNTKSNEDEEEKEDEYENFKDKNLSGEKLTCGCQSNKEANNAHPTEDEKEEKDIIENSSASSFDAQQPCGCHSYNYESDGTQQIEYVEINKEHAKPEAINCYMNDKETVEECENANGENWSGEEQTYSYEPENEDDNTKPTEVEKEEGVVFPYPKEETRSDELVKCGCKSDKDDNNTKPTKDGKPSDEQEQCTCDTRNEADNNSEGDEEITEWDADVQPIEQNKCEYPFGFKWDDIFKSNDVGSSSDATQPCGCHSYNYESDGTQQIEYVEINKEHAKPEAINCYMDDKETVEECENANGENWSGEEQTYSYEPENDDDNTKPTEVEKEEGVVFPYPKEETRSDELVKCGCKSDKDDNNTKPTKDGKPSDEQEQCTCDTRNEANNNSECDEEITEWDADVQPIEQNKCEYPFGFKWDDIFKSNDVGSSSDATQPCGCHSYNYEADGTQQIEYVEINKEHAKPEAINCYMDDKETVEECENANGENWSGEEQTYSYEPENEDDNTKPTEVEKEEGVVFPYPKEETRSDELVKFGCKSDKDDNNTKPTKDGKPSDEQEQCTCDTRNEADNNSEGDEEITEWDADVQPIEQNKCEYPFGFKWDDIFKSNDVGSSSDATQPCGCHSYNYESDGTQQIEYVEINKEHAKPEAINCYMDDKETVEECENANGENWSVEEQTYSYEPENEDDNTKPTEVEKEEGVVFPYPKEETRSDELVKCGCKSDKDDNNTKPTKDGKPSDEQEQCTCDTRNEADNNSEGDEEITEWDADVQPIEQNKCEYPFGFKWDDIFKSNDVGSSSDATQPCGCHSYNYEADGTQQIEDVEINGEDEKPEAINCYMDDKETVEECENANGENWSGEEQTYSYEPENEDDNTKPTEVEKEEGVVFPYPKEETRSDELVKCGCKSDKDDNNTKPTKDGKPSDEQEQCTCDTRNEANNNSECDEEITEWDADVQPIEQNKCEYPFGFKWDDIFKSNDVGSSSDATQPCGCHSYNYESDGTQQIEYVEINGEHAKPEAINFYMDDKETVEECENANGENWSGEEQTYSYEPENEDDNTKPTEVEKEEGVVFPYPKEETRSDELVKCGCKSDKDDNNTKPTKDGKPSDEQEQCTCDTRNEANNNSESDEEITEWDADVQPIEQNKCEYPFGFKWDDIFKSNDVGSSSDATQPCGCHSYNYEADGTQQIEYVEINKEHAKPEAINCYMDDKETVEECENANGENWSGEEQTYSYEPENEDDNTKPTEVEKEEGVVFPYPKEETRSDELVKCGCKSDKDDNNTKPTKDGKPSDEQEQCTCDTRNEADNNSEGDEEITEWDADVQPIEQNKCEYPFGFKWDDIFKSNDVGSSSDATQPCGCHSYNYEADGTQQIEDVEINGEDEKPEAINCYMDDKETVEECENANGENWSGEEQTYSYEPENEDDNTKPTEVEKEEGVVFPYPKEETRSDELVKCGCKSDKDDNNTKPTKDGKPSDEQEQCTCDTRNEANNNSECDEEITEWDADVQPIEQNKCEYPFGFKWDDIFKSNDVGSSSDATQPCGCHSYNYESDGTQQIEYVEINKEHAKPEAINFYMDDKETVEECENANGENWSGEEQTYSYEPENEDDNTKPTEVEKEEGVVFPYPKEETRSDELVKCGCKSDKDDNNTKPTKDGKPSDEQEQCTCDRRNEANNNSESDEEITEWDADVQPIEQNKCEYPLGFKWDDIFKSNDVGSSSDATQPCGCHSYNYEADGTQQIEYVEINKEHAKPEAINCYMDDKETVEECENANGENWSGEEQTYSYEPENEDDNTKPTEVEKEEGVVFPYPKEETRSDELVKCGCKSDKDDNNTKPTKDGKPSDEQEQCTCDTRNEADNNSEGDEEITEWDADVQPIEQNKCEYPFGFKWDDIFKSNDVGSSSDATQPCGCHSYNYEADGTQQIEDVEINGEDEKPEAINCYMDDKETVEECENANGENWSGEEQTYSYEPENEDDNTKPTEVEKEEGVVFPYPKEETRSDELVKCGCKSDKDDNNTKPTKDGKPSDEQEQCTCDTRNEANNNSECDEEITEWDADVQPIEQNKCEYPFGFKWDDIFKSNDVGSSSDATQPCGCHSYNYESDGTQQIEYVEINGEHAKPEAINFYMDDKETVEECENANGVNWSGEEQTYSYEPENEDDNTKPTEVEKEEGVVFPYPKEETRSDELVKCGCKSDKDDNNTKPTKDGKPSDEQEQCTCDTRNEPDNNSECDEEITEWDADVQPIEQNKCEYPFGFKWDDIFKSNDVGSSSDATQPCGCHSYNYESDGTQQIEYVEINKEHAKPEAINCYMDDKETVEECENANGENWSGEEQTYSYEPENEDDNTKPTEVEKEEGVVFPYPKEETRSDELVKCGCKSDKDDNNTKPTKDGKPSDEQEQCICDTRNEADNNSECDEEITEWDADVQPIEQNKCEYPFGFKWDDIFKSNDVGRSSDATQPCGCHSYNYESDGTQQIEYVEINKEHAKPEAINCYMDDKETVEECENANGENWSVEEQTYSYEPENEDDNTKPTEVEKEEGVVFPYPKEETRSDELVKCGCKSDKDDNNTKPTKDGKPSDEQEQCTCDTRNEADNNSECGEEITEWDADVQPIEQNKCEYPFGFKWDDIFKSNDVGSSSDATQPCGCHSYNYEADGTQQIEDVEINGEDEKPEAINCYMDDKETVEECENANDENCSDKEKTYGCEPENEDDNTKPTEDENEDGNISEDIHKYSDVEGSNDNPKPSSCICNTEIDGINPTNDEAKVEEEPELGEDTLNSEDENSSDKYQPCSRSSSNEDDETNLKQSEEIEEEDKNVKSTAFSEAECQFENELEEDYKNDEDKNPSYELLPCNYKEECPFNNESEDDFKNIEGGNLSDNQQQCSFDSIHEAVEITPTENEDDTYSESIWSHREVSPFENESEDKACLEELVSFEKSHEECDSLEKSLTVFVECDGQYDEKTDVCYSEGKMHKVYEKQCIDDDDDSNDYEYECRELENLKLEDDEYGLEVDYSREKHESYESERKSWHYNMIITVCTTDTDEENCDCSSS